MAGSTEKLLDRAGAGRDWRACSACRTLFSELSCWVLKPHGTYPAVGGS